MKPLLFLIFYLVSFPAFTQNVSGLFSGVLINDSTKKVQNYELGLSEYRGKITGYSYTTFVVNDTFYYSIKRIKATKEKGNLIVEDVKMLANNFPESPARHVRQIVTIPLNEQDSLTEIKGKWTTTQTKEYYSLHGGVEMKRETDSTHSALIAHLTELNKLNAADDVAAATIKVKEDKIKIKKNEASDKVPATVQKTMEILPAEKRVTKIIQTLDILSDSLVLSFYDNGVVDGDTISVYLNGQNIISKNRLTAAATKKTIYTNTLATDVFELLLVAENLGSIPPNTGLLLIQDGEQKYEVRFSTDMQTNASITLHKRK